MKLVKIIFGAIRGAKETAKKIDCSKWSRVAIFFDIIYCKFKYHATYKEYLTYAFYNHKNRYRKNFLIEYHQQTKFKKLNNGLKITRSKYGFFSLIPECFNREIIMTAISGEDEFVYFAKKHGKIVVKPDVGSHGKDINIFLYTDDEQARKYYATFSKDIVCEEYIQQHEKINEINPFSVNSIRIVSFLEQGEVKIVSATLKTGSRPGVIVDNMCSEGIGAQIDIPTGIINTHGFDYRGNTYVKHPISGVQFLGFAIPNWDKAIQQVKDAHKKLPQCGIFGWDIAITQTGIDIIEANNKPGTRLMQMGDKKPKGKELLRAIKQAKKTKN